MVKIETESFLNGPGHLDSLNRPRFLIVRVQAELFCNKQSDLLANGSGSLLS